MIKVFAKLFVPFICFLFLSQMTAVAGPLSYTGRELLDLPNVTLPSNQRNIVGDSALFQPVPDVQALFVFSFEGFEVDIENFGVRLNLRRLDDDNGTLDFDPHFFLGDGTSSLGGPVTDQGPDRLGVFNESVIVPDGSSTAVLNELFVQQFDVDVAIGEDFDFDLLIQSGLTNSTITSSINGQLSNLSTLSTVLDGSQPLDFTFFSHDLIENYRLNSITFFSGVTQLAQVSEPGAMVIMAFALCAFGAMRIRRRPASLGMA